jgi:hypothetical protein
MSYGGSGEPSRFRVHSLSGYTIGSIIVLMNARDG